MLRRLLLAAVAGAGLMYLFDPNRGRKRRHMLRDRTRSAWHHGSTRLRHLSRALGANVYGYSQRATHLRPAPGPEANDATLVQRVQSEIYRDPHVPKGHININSEYSVVVVRGQVESPDQIKRIVRLIRRVPGVRDVVNLMHTPGTPAPRR